MNGYRSPRLRRAATVCALVAGLAATSVTVSAAHPLGNFTVNHHTGLTLYPDRIDAKLVVDRAEIAAAQERVRVDRDADGAVDAAEARTHARHECATAAGRLSVEADGHRLAWTRTSGSFTYRPGEAGLTTSRLTCTLTSATDLRRPSHVSVRTGYDTDRIGWQEITARGVGITLTDADVPTRSTTDELRRYPTDPLSDPLDQRSAALRTAPGDGVNAPGRVSDVLPGAGPLTTALDRVSAVFDSLVGSRELTVPVGLLALLLAVVLGASHAVLPGHGKTIMAAYLAGRRGTPRDAVTVGATVTLTHTAGVLVLGLALPIATTLAGETVLTWLGAASGLLVTGIGLWLLRAALLNRPIHGHHHAHDHHHGHHDDGHHHHHGADHGPHHGDVTPRPRNGQAEPSPHQGTALAVLTKTHSHPPSGHPVHSHAPHSHRPPATATRGGLIGMGIAGGLVPSPSALVVLLGAVALGRTAFGILLVVGYGLGMATTLTLAGLILVRLRDRIEQRSRTSARPRPALLRWLARTGPVATSTLVLLVGIGLTLRAASGPW
ncbi:nickel/cobalt transporter [Streptomyces sp. NPDC059134]|uniref:nickel/cobalt transporter n=1 Tax=Streptomyces sp. NPDC059134 TaxID=3346738 RepID=UPI00369C56B0